jgi:polyisoprenoid-binding protein YceI
MENLMRALFAAIVSMPVLALSACGSAPNQDQASEAAETPAAATSWSLDTEASRIAFASIKATEVIETHYFPGLTGEIGPDGAASVSVPLDQVETKIDLRNERMREMFFQTDQFPTATISTSVNAQDFADLKTGERVQTEIEGTLSLHGAEAQIYTDAFVTRIAPTRIEIESAEPVIVYVSDFGLEAGLESLRDVAGLPSITSSVPVTFTFVFEAQT